MTEEDTFKALKRIPFAQVVSYLLSADNKGGQESVRIAVESMGWTVDDVRIETEKLTGNGGLLQCLSKK